MTGYVTSMLRGVHSLFTSGSQSKPPQDTFLTKVYQSSKDQPLSSPLRNVQQTASEGSIEKISFTFLSTFNDRSDCKLARKAIAEEVLKEGVDWVNPVDWKQFTFWKQFALMLCPGFILRTPFEGGSTSSSIEAALFHTSLYKGTRFFSGNIRPDILKKIDDSLNHLKKFLNLLPFKSDLPINKGDLERYSKAYLEGIKKKISEDQRSNGQGTLYITLGYRGGRLNPGHAIPCKITEEEDVVVLTLFNLGNGSDAHPILNYTLNQEKMSYCFLPIRIKKELFYGDLGKAAFCYLLRYLADAPPNDSSYDGNDIYDIFCQFFLYGNAAVDPSLGSDLKKYEADGQISGNCTEVAVRNIIQDILIDHNISKLDREKYFLNRDFCALIAAHQAIASCDSYHPAAPQLLHEAAKFFGATVLSFYGRKEISEQELVRAQAVVHQISRGIKNLHSYGYSQQPAHPPEETYVSREFPRIPLFAQVPTSDDLPLRNDVDVHRSFLPILIGDPCSKGAEDFSMKLGKKVEEWIETANNLPFEKVFRFVSDCIRKLPIPLKKVESEVDPWERIELDQVKGILKTMNAFLYQGLKGVNVAKYDESSLFFDQFIMIYTVYAISDKLARRSEEETKLGDYSSPFFPEPFLFSPNGFTSLPLKEDNDRFTRIKKYFSEKQTLSRFIFPISPILNVHQFVDSHLSPNYTREQLQGRNHIEYLSQFIFHSEFGKTEERLAQTYSSRWIEALPAQVYYLYYSSFLSHLLFSAPGKAFPEKLEFSGSRLSGQDVLKIKNPFFLEGETTDSQLFTENHQPKLDQPIRDPRFCTSGGKESNGSFIDLDSPEVRDLTTNEALCYSLSEGDAWNISEADMRTLLNITRKDNLMFFQALQEFSLSKNHHLFNHPGVQAVLDRSFFQPGFILERMEQEQDTLTYDFRQLIRENLRRYNNDTSQLSGILFLLRTGISFETYTSSEPYWVSRLSGKDESRLFTDKSREPTFSLYRQTIKKLLEEQISVRERNELLLHRCFLKTAYNELECFFFRSEASLAGIFSAHFEAQICYSHLEVDYHWLTSHLSQSIRDITYKYRYYFSALGYPTPSSRICSMVFATITKSCQNSRRQIGGWQGEFPQFSSGSYTLDFFDGTLLHKKYGKLKHIDTVGFDDKYQSIKMVDIQSQHGDLVWIDKQGKVVSFDEQLQYLPSSNKWEANRPRKANKPLSTSLKSEKEFVGFPEGQEGESFLAWSPRFPLMYQKGNSGAVQIYSKNKRCPVFNIENKEGKVFYTSLDEKGLPLPFELANLSGLKKGDYFYQYTVRYAHFSQILCSVHKEKNEVNELNFWSMNLLFLRDENGLKSVQFSGFYLMSHPADCLDEEEKKVYNQIQEELNAFEGAFILHNHQTDKWLILLPNGDFSHGTDDFSTEVFSNSESLITTYNQYEFDLSEKVLKTFNRELKSYVALSLLFKMQNDYEKAYKYLSKIESPVFFDLDVLENLIKFTKIENYSISSIIFNLNLCLFVINNQRLMLEEQFDGKPESSFYREFMFWGMRTYETYLKLSDESCYSRVPAKIDLPTGEKVKLIVAFKDFYKKYYKNDKIGWEIRWTRDHQVLHNQFNVYFLRDGNSFTIPSQEIPLHPPIFSSVVPPSSLRLIDFKDMIKTYKGFKENSIQDGLEESVSLFDDYPVRTTSLAIQAHFPKLYEKARKCNPTTPDPFDFTLHALIKTSLVSRDNGASLGQLLFWVRHFSDQFASPEFSLEGITRSNIDSFAETLKRISEKVQSLETEQKYTTFVETILKRKTTIEMTETIHIKRTRGKAYTSCEIKKQPIRERQGDLEEFLKEIHDEIYQLFNHPYGAQDKGLPPDKDQVEQELLFQLKKDSEQIFYFSKKAEKLPDSSLPELLLKQVLLKGNLGFLYKVRDMLPMDQMQHLCYLVNEWYHTRVLIECKREGKNNPYVPYDFQSYPEISYFYLKTKKFPNRAQLKTYQWVCEGLAKNRNRHFQLPTGCGKTDVITPLLNLRAKKLGLMPISCVTQIAYPIDKENLSYNLGVLEEDLCYLEVGMHMINKLSSQDLEFIFSQLKQYKSEDKSLIMIRYTYDAFFLLRDLACRGTEPDKGFSEERGNKIRWVQNILNFFEEECLLICDESHRNIDPLTRSILGTGPFVSLSEIESHHLLELMKPLTGIYSKVVCQDQRDVAEVSSLKKIDLQGNPSSEDIQAIQAALAQHYLETTFKEIPQNERGKFIEYWTNQNAPQPILLKAWGEVGDRQNANLIALTGYFLLVLLPDITKMRTQIDHTRSLYPHRKIEVPCHNKLPTTAEYESYKTAVLTIKGNYQRGLFRSDIVQILQDMIKSNSEEESQGFDFYKTPTHKILKKWLIGSKLESFRVRDIVLSNERQVDELFDILFKNPNVIEYFLKNYCFPQIGNTSEQLFCTSTNTFNGFKKFIAFSATPHDKLVNPYDIITAEDYRQDLSFQTEVKKKLCEENNAQMLFIDSADHFFSYMQENYKKTFEEATVLIDSRGFFSSYSNEQLATEWLNANCKLDGILYCMEERSLSVNREETVCLLLRNSNKILKLKGSNIKTACKEYGLDWEALHFGTIFDPAHIESTNILQKPNAKAFFFLEDGLTTSSLIQAVTRLRGFLTLNQTITWVLSPNLSQKISEDETLTVANILLWTDSYKKEQEELRIVLNAFQEITFVIAKLARKNLKALHAEESKIKDSKMESVIEYFQKVAQGLLETRPRDAYEAFGQHEVKRETKKVLLSFAKSHYRKFDYDVTYEDNKELQNSINGIIEDVEERIKHIYATLDCSHVLEIGHQAGSSQHVALSSSERQAGSSQHVALSSSERQAGSSQHVALSSSERQAGSSQHVALSSSERQAGSSQHVALSSSERQARSSQHVALSSSERQAGSSQHVALSSSGHQEIHTQKQRQQENQCFHPIPISLDGEYGDTSICSPAYPQAKKTEARSFFKTSFFKDDFYLLENYVRTAKLSSLESESEYLKPIHFFIICIIEDEGCLSEWAFVDSNEIVSTVLDDLINCPPTVEGLEHTAFLVSAQGRLIQKGCGAIQPDQAVVDRIIESEWMENLVIDAALINGRIQNINSLSKRIERLGSWKEFEELWNTILQTLPNPETAQTQLYEKLKKKYERNAISS